MKLDEFVVPYVVQPGIVLIGGLLYISVKNASERLDWTKEILTLGVFCLVVWIFEDLGCEILCGFSEAKINESHEAMGHGPTYLTYISR